MKLLEIFENHACGGNSHNIIANENFMALLLRHAGGNGKLAINFSWPKLPSD